MCVWEGWKVIWDVEWVWFLVPNLENTVLLHVHLLCWSRHTRSVRCTLLVCLGGGGKKHDTYNWQCYFYLHFDSIGQ